MYKRPEIHISFSRSGLHFDIEKEQMAEMLTDLFWYLAIVGTYTISISGGLLNAPSPFAKSGHLPF